MCGIYATNTGSLYQNIVNLQSLEYRGYDSSGFIYIDKNNKVGIHKNVGNVSNLMLNIKDEDVETLAFAGHTRWATHGKVNKVNAHPHLDIEKRYAIIHNGILENYMELIEKYDLKYKLQSETDTEVLINIIAKKCKTNNTLESIQQTVSEIEGANSFIVLDTLDAKEFYVATKGTKLDIFVSTINDEDSGVYITSNSFTKYSDNGYHLVFNDNTFVTKINNNITTLKNLYQCVEKQKTYIADKKHYQSFMLKEIYEQPIAVENLFRGRLNKKRIVLGGLDQEYINNIKHIRLLACGSSLHAAYLGQRYIEEIARIHTTVEQAGEFRYRNPVIDEDLFVFISQSGETADVLESIKYVKENYNNVIMGICNTAGSNLARETNFGIYTRAGQEIGVASTKTYTNQVLTLLLLSLYLQTKENIITELYKLPMLIQSVLDDESIIQHINELSSKLCAKTSCIFLGRGYNHPTALEAALKVKELTYIHAEGYSAAEMKHGPLALIDSKMPVIVFANASDNYHKIINNVNEILCRNGDVTLITDKKCDLNIKQILIPHSSKYISPVLCNIISQLLAYKTASLLGKNVDQPRNLAKSVTVE